MVARFGRNGLFDWLVQRISAVIILLYVLCHSAIIISTSEMSYDQWQSLFAGTTMRLFSLVTLVALCVHAWIGLWTVATDYLTTRMLGANARAIRLCFLFICLAVLVVYFIWGILILWSMS